MDIFDASRGLEVAHSIDPEMKAMFPRFLNIECNQVSVSLVVQSPEDLEGNIDISASLGTIF